ncbi:hypothetical protein DFH27DRAFT_531453 [Peziza echinospora]|nr:hypothetical protein DFH27DRAFT_531453 [Peziza echinospora]
MSSTTEYSTSAASGSGIGPGVADARVTAATNARVLENANASDEEDVESGDDGDDHDEDMEDEDDDQDMEEEDDDQDMEEDDEDVIDSADEYEEPRGSFVKPLEPVWDSIYGYPGETIPEDIMYYLRDGGHKRYKFVGSNRSIWARECPHHPYFANLIDDPHHPMPHEIVAIPKSKNLVMFLLNKYENMGVLNKWEVGEMVMQRTPYCIHYWDFCDCRYCDRRCDRWRTAWERRRMRALRQGKA